ncbi:hypothetical protein LIER_00308 [Lithospermum erythrorhizon]|uniref:Uncharacterized protein n=1 Tax=Lithospermum erythrorhizon TaxID=34254 RepID=A0AAV3NH10_LITER
MNASIQKAIVSPHRYGFWEFSAADRHSSLTTLESYDQFKRKFQNVAFRSNDTMRDNNTKRSKGNFRATPLGFDTTVEVAKEAAPPSLQTRKIAKAVNIIMLSEFVVDVVKISPLHTRSQHQASLVQKSHVILY